MTTEPGIETVAVTDDEEPNPWTSRGLPAPAYLDPNALIGYVIEYDVKPWTLRDILEEAIGPDYGRTYDQIDAGVHHVRRIEELRADLRRRLPEVAGQISEVAELIDELRSDAVFDEEYLSFDGNQMLTALAEAERQVKLAERVNPFRERPAETSRRKVLSEAAIMHKTKRGHLQLSPRQGIDVAALADLVAAGMGTFHTDDNFCDPYPRITGVALNEAGYAAAVAAGAQEPF